MGEYWQVPVEVKNLCIALLEIEFGSDLGAAGRDDGKLQLRHATTIESRWGKYAHGSSCFAGLSANPRSAWVGQDA